MVRYVWWRSAEDGWRPKRPGPASDRDSVTRQTLRAGIRAPPPEKPYHAQDHGRTRQQRIDQDYACRMYVVTHVECMLLTTSRAGVAGISGIAGHTCQAFLLPRRAVLALFRDGFQQHALAEVALVEQLRDGADADGLLQCKACNVGMVWCLLNGMV